MNTLNNPSLRANAQTLRKNMTEEERRLWFDYLKDLPVVVHRQKVIGRYIVDFCIPSAKLVIELDGAQHYTKDGHERDSKRDLYLQEKGYRVLRYSNSDVNQSFQSVCEDINSYLTDLPLEGKVPRRGG